MICFTFVKTGPKGEKGDPGDMGPIGECKGQAVVTNLRRQVNTLTTYINTHKIDNLNFQCDCEMCKQIREGGLFIIENCEAENIKASSKMNAGYSLSIK